MKQKYEANINLGFTSDFECEDVAEAKKLFLKMRDELIDSFRNSGSRFPFEIQIRILDAFLGLIEDNEKVKSHDAIFQLTQFFNKQV